jgi:hypothetical protein
MAVQEQVSKLLDRLVRLTSEGKVDWSRTADENSFLAAVAKFTVTISAEHASRPNPDYRLQIADRSGRTIEDVVEESSGPAAVLGTYGLLKDLFETARRRASHVEEALSEMLSSLEQIR